MRNAAPAAVCCSSRLQCARRRCIMADSSSEGGDYLEAISGPRPKAHSGKGRKRKASVAIATPAGSSGMYGGGPKHRTAEQHRMVASRMREGKRLQRLQTEVKTFVGEAVEHIQSSSGVRRGHRFQFRSRRLWRLCL